MKDWQELYQKALYFSETRSVMKSLRQIDKEDFRQALALACWEYSKMASEFNNKVFRSWVHWTISAFLKSYGYHRQGNTYHLIESPSEYL